MSAPTDDIAARWAAASAALLRAWEGDTADEDLWPYVDDYCAACVDAIQGHDLVPVLVPAAHVGGVCPDCDAPLVLRPTCRHSYDAQEEMGLRPGCLPEDREAYTVRISGEAVEKLRAWARVMRVVDRGGPGNEALPGLGHLAICALARDLADVLKAGQ